ncbi:MAG: cation transporter dimerization domain-containing protein [Oscillospiraceae bacterium]
MFAYNRGIGRKLNSPGMSATAMDLLGLHSHGRGPGLDAAGALHGRERRRLGRRGGGLLHHLSGFKAARRRSALLGNPPDPQLVRDIMDIVTAHPEVMKVHDLIVHDYGPGRLMVSLHAEVPGDGDIRPARRHRHGGVRAGVEAGLRGGHTYGPREPGRHQDRPHATSWPRRRRR